MLYNNLIRENIQRLAPYSCARNEFAGPARVNIDANENPFNSPDNRYPDPLQRHLKSRIAALKGIPEDWIFLGNGSDESIDLAFRIFCEPGVDNVVAMEPTYGMYRVCADINNVEYRAVPLDDDFSLRPEALLDRCDEHTKLLFLCSPNNPTGNLLDEEAIRYLLEHFPGMLLLDEAYIDFASRPSLVSWIERYPRLVVFQTFSKAWGSAGLRLGMALARPEVIDYYNKVKYPYNINILTQERILALLEHPEQVEAWVEVLLRERTRLEAALPALTQVEKVYPSDANFLLVKVTDANALYAALLAEGIVVRNRHTVMLCGNCLRITVGSPDENTLLLEALSRLAQ